MVFGAEDLQETPPPSHPPEFSEIVQFVTVGEELTQETPPPVFAEIVQFLRVGDEL